MSPEQLARNNTESGHQKALFAWAAMARRWGFDVANQMHRYQAGGAASEPSPVGNRPFELPALRWLHAIPNGGARDHVTAARMKAEGVKAGVYDIFLPVPRAKLFSAKNDKTKQIWMMESAGLYIELKKLGKLSNSSDDQKSFGAHCTEFGYANFICEGWRHAADTIQRYMTE